jgi:precorrin-6Y C5,15-methyltransferase (decarboxylating)
VATAAKIHIIGIGEDGLQGLTTSAQELIAQADLILGEERELAHLPRGRAERFVVGANLDEAVRRLEATRPDEKVVVLASGDPLFYGVSRFFCARLGKQRFEVVPHVSSMQLAFARVKENWEEAFLTNLATHELGSVLEQIRGAEKVGLFTSEDCPPPRVAQLLLDAQIDYFTAYVCENLCSPDERVTQGELAEIAAQEFSPLNVMILIRKPHVPDRPSTAIGRRLFGNPDAAFAQSRPKRGLLTPAEIRAMALAELDLGPASIVWDVGAGSGSVAIEAAQLAPQGTVYAIEQDVEDHQLIIENVRRFSVKNVVPVLGHAPEAWRELPAPDAIFIGGTGRWLSRLVDAAYERLRVGGRLVTTMGSLDNVTETFRVLHRHTPDVRVWMINLARGNYQLERVRFEALNPTFLISVMKRFPAEDRGANQ